MLFVKLHYFRRNLVNSTNFSNKNGRLPIFEGKIFYCIRLLFTDIENWNTLENDLNGNPRLQFLRAKLRKLRSTGVTFCDAW